MQWIQLYYELRTTNISEFKKVYLLTLEFSCDLRHSSFQEVDGFPRGPLNMNMSSYPYGVPIMKIGRSHDSLIIIMETFCPESPFSY